MNKTPLVGILMGSDNDYEIMKETAVALTQFGIPFEMTVSSAHRTPERTANIVRGAKDRGIKILIAGAGAAAHLAGVVAAETTLPVIAVPIDATALNGMDASAGDGADAGRDSRGDHGDRQGRGAQRRDLCRADAGRQ